MELSISTALALVIFLMVICVAMLILLASALRVCSSLNAHPQDRPGGLLKATLYMFASLGFIVMGVSSMHLATHSGSMGLALAIVGVTGWMTIGGVAIAAILAMVAKDAIRTFGPPQMREAERPLYVQYEEVPPTVTRLQRKSRDLVPIKGNGQ